MASSSQASTFTYTDGDRDHEIDISNPTYSSRESLGVFVIGSKVWKVFTNTNSLERSQRDYQLADVNGLPIDGATIYQGVVRRPGRSSSSGYALVTVNMSDRHFFSLQQGSSQFRQLIGQINDRTVLERIYRACQSAVNVGLRDPQGFIGVSHNEPITFIDVHTSAAPDGRGGFTFGGSQAAVDMLAIVRSRLG
ncbi:hypothetical protein DFH11DRAFT_1127063 [Phellopilus nigrolimitatus]|nr:hypothetical protein DFH11DRAFT_1127063 [Phellopilus nigrolimitatus]